jgi:hypothetical protein
MTQTTSFPEAQTKIIFDIGCDNFVPHMSIVFSIHTMHLWKSIMRNCVHRNHIVLQLEFKK